MTGYTHVFSSTEEEEVCPTCLEEYTPENPKIVTNCSHHFHLGCIYEWMERSESCPVQYVARCDGIRDILILEEFNIQPLAEILQMEKDHEIVTEASLYISCKAILYLYVKIVMSLPCFTCMLIHI
ncbi:E3 ubiquitin-protein ligase RHF2A-like [Impatiens glandulifera]|uniref:E3 ubiquitin-protein ligase RHF2A-like n=1 Tax=Impatiens glandulifera TaxID=253017 RepID=UPI001FB0F493|nr:E3 ubiquitin-protein ligase RHF2A-like [Impatiens glandulifera]